MSKLTLSTYQEDIRVASPPPNPSQREGNSSGTTRMIPYNDENGTLTFKVLVSPRASKTDIVGEHDGALRVRIAAPPVEGAANEELTRILAKSFGVSRTAVEISSGHSSKRKTVSITGPRAGLVETLACLAMTER